MLNIDNFLNHPYVFHSEWEDLIIFCYTRGCQYDRAWDDVTRAARGIIFNKVTGELVARPWEKFYNLLEIPATSLGNLPDGPFTVTIKIDGSMGIVYPYKDQYWVATKGSFQSDQAKWATNWLHENIHTSEFKKGWTYLYEMVFKKNKIVIDYGDYEGMTLLGCINNETGIEMPYGALLEEGARTKSVVVQQVTGFKTMEDLYVYCKTLPTTQEGFVVTFSNGLKIKIKGAEYCRIHKMVSRMTPLAFWEAWDLELKDIPKEYLSQMPEEFREACDALHKQIYDMHWEAFKKTTQLYNEAKALLGNEDKKTWSEWVKELYPEDWCSIMDFHNNKESNVWWRIHKRVRPAFNLLPADLKDSDRLQRILQEN